VYIWQASLWPTFVFSTDCIEPKLKQLLCLQEQLFGKARDLPEGLDQEAEMDALIQSALQTSEIEGETLNVGSVRSSVAKQLGLEQAGLAQTTRQTESLVAMLIAATSNLNNPVSEDLLCQWQEALFPEPSLLNNISVGELRGEAAMQVVSQKGGREFVHFEAPPRAGLEKELNAFIEWFNAVDANEHGFIRAAIGHLWFITIHPFDDGNGRLARALTDRALAQTEQTSVRFYSLSAAIEANRKAYYDVLENTQNCKTRYQEGNDSQAADITAWVAWFLDVLAEAMQEGVRRIERIVAKTRFWQTHSQTVLSERQIKALNRLLDCVDTEFKQGIAARQYQGITKVSKATATRDLADLLDKGCLIPFGGGGRSARYVINYAK